MHRLTVRDVMTRDVVTARTDTSFKQIARQLGENSISAVPVLDEHGSLAGVVSEADLLPKTGYPDRAGKARPLTVVGRLRRTLAKLREITDPWA